MALCQQTKSTEQRLEAMRWSFGKRHCRTITLASDDSDHGNHFELNAIDSSYSNENKFIIFLDDGVAVAPTPAADQTLISVSVTAGDSANVKASAIAAALLSNSVEVRTVVTDGVIEVQNIFVGTITVEDISFAGAITFEIGQLGFGGYIGQTGESEMTTNVEMVQLLDDAQGTIIQDEIIVGYGVEITVPLREMSTERWQELIGNVSGNNITIDGSEIVGIAATKKLYQSMFQYSGRLIGHPVRNDLSDISEDIVMLNTAPKMNSINFSGSAIQEAEFLFSAYKDANAPEEINLVARGDHSKF